MSKKENTEDKNGGTDSAVTGNFGAALRQLIEDVISCFAE